jgi:hypothetical protein
VYQKLLVHVALKLWVWVISLGPGFLKNLGRRSRFSLVETLYGAEIYLFIEEVLESGRYIVVVTVVVRMVVRLLPVIVIVAV